MYLSALGSLGPEIDAGDVLGGPSGLALLLWTLAYLGLLAAGARALFVNRDL